MKLKEKAIECTRTKEQLPKLSSTTKATKSSHPQCTTANLNVRWSIGCILITRKHGTDDGTDNLLLIDGKDDRCINRRQFSEEEEAVVVLVMSTVVECSSHCKR